MSTRAIMEAARVGYDLVIKANEQVQEKAPGGDKGGTVIGKAYLAKKGPNGQGRCQGTPNSRH